MTRSDPQPPFPDSKPKTTNLNDPDLAPTRPSALQNGFPFEETPNNCANYRDMRPLGRPQPSDSLAPVALPGVSSLLQSFSDLPPPTSIGSAVSRQTNGHTHPGPTHFDFRPHHSRYSGRSSPHASNPHPFEQPPALPLHYSSHPRQERPTSYHYPTPDHPDRPVWPRTPQTTSPQTPASQFDTVFSPRPQGLSINSIEEPSYLEEANNTGDDSGTDSVVEANIPRFVRSEVIHNEGEYYIYDEGTRCPANIDVEPVNQRWGVTKAGKPRKRLAVACLTCREKKIKCEPGEPKCVQCEKAGKECRVRPARGQPTVNHPIVFGNATPTSPPPTDVPMQPVGGLLPKSVPAPSSPKPPKRRATPPNDRWGPSRYSRDSHWGPPLMLPRDSFKKRRRSSTSLNHSYQDSPSAPESYDPSIDSDNTESRPTTKNGDSSDTGPPRRASLGEEWLQDPYEQDPESVIELVELYLTHVNSALPCLFPPRQLLSWIKDTQGKSEASLMLIYAILALSSKFRSGEPIGRRFAEIATYAETCQRGHFTLQLVQTRVLLAAYCLSIGNENAALEYCGQAKTVVAVLKLNLESNEDLDSGETGYLTLNHNAYLECRRRTFWSVYCMSRLCARLNSRVNLTETQIEIKYPQNNQSYEEQAPTLSPPFHSLNETNGNVEANEFRYFSPFGHLVLMCTIWGDTLNKMFHLIYNRENSGDKEFERLHTETTERLETWSKHLPSNLSFAPNLPIDNTNLRAATQSDYAALYMAMHALHSMTAVTLKRYGHFDAMRQMRHHTLIREAVEQARIWVMLFHSFAKFYEQPSHQLSGIQLPFVSFAAMTAVDVISARGRVSEIDGLCRAIAMVMPVLHEMIKYWDISIVHVESIARRLSALRRAQTTQQTDNEVGVEEVPGVGLCFAMTMPIDGEEALKKFDLLYTTSLVDYFVAMGEDYMILG